MTDQPPAVVVPENWYRTYWQELGTKFLFAFLVGMMVIGVAFLFALYFVVRIGTAHGYADYAESLMR